MKRKLFWVFFILVLGILSGCTKDDEKSSDAALKSLGVSVGKLDKDFKPEVFNYAMDVANEIATITITATANHSKAKVEGTGAKTLNVGKNVCDIKVKAENGDSRTYTITITRKDVVKSNDATLKILTVNVGSIDFKPEVMAYALEVGNDVATATITATATNAKATVDGAGDKTLNVGKNSFDIIVKAETGDTKTYNITITRKDKTATLDKTKLETAIKDAQAKHDAAVEGTEAGKYKAGAKAELLAAIKKISATLTDASATQASIDKAIADLAAALKVFDSKKNSGGTVEPVPENTIRIHYNRTDGIYEGYGLWLWNDVAKPSATWPTDATPFDKTDDYGAYVDVKLADGAKSVGMVPLKIKDGDAGKDGGDKIVNIIGTKAEIWIKQGSDTVFVVKPVELAKNTLRIHYNRTDGNYEGYGLWLFDDVETPCVTWPTDANPFTGTDSFGAYVDVKYKEGAKAVGFICMKIKDGDAGKDGGDKRFQLLDKFNQVFVKQGDDTVYISATFGMATALLKAELIAADKISLAFTATDGLKKEDITVKDKDGKDVKVTDLKVSGTGAEITGAFATDKAPFKVTYMGRTLAVDEGLKLFDTKFGYTGNDLGCTYNAGNATLKVWAPKASKVTAVIYDKSNQNTEVGRVDMKLGDKGVWDVTLKPSDAKATDLKGYYYHYEVTNNGVKKLALDPYAKSMATCKVEPNGTIAAGEDPVGKAAIVDPSSIGPALTFANVPGYSKPEDAIIYEVHLRDFTVDPSIESQLNGKRWGSYESFISRLPYLKSLGITHIQLLPVMAWYQGNETKMNEREMMWRAKGNQYNWGYDPHNFFSLEGAYSENPDDPELRIKEFKNLVKAIHDSGLAVTLDVVYNHTALISILGDIVPNYYYFRDAAGNDKMAYGGGSLGTTHAMTRKLIVDSVKYWTNEYKIDGYRFDLAGSMDAETIQMAYDEAKKINPNMIFAGEGWTTFSGDAGETVQPCDQQWAGNSIMSMFSDELRNELKSGFGIEGQPRFITGGARPISIIFNNVKAQPSNAKVDDPSDVLTYIQAHDNMTLHDVIAQSIKKSPATSEEELQKRVRLGNAIMMTSQGVPFINAGQEYGNTKQWFGAGVPEDKYTELKDDAGKSFGYFIHDSYDSSDAINMFKWDDVLKDGIKKTTMEYTKGLMALRRSTDAFRLATKAVIDSNITLLEIPEMKLDGDTLIGYKCKATDGAEYQVFINGDSTVRTLTLKDDLTTGKVLVDNDEAGTEPVKTLSGVKVEAKKITIDPLTAVVIKR